MADRVVLRRPQWTSVTDVPMAARVSADSPRLPHRCIRLIAPCTRAVPSRRFTASDPVAIPHGSPYANGYTHAFGNPMIATDPSGLWPDWSAIGDSFATAGTRIVDTGKGIGLGVADTAVAAGTGAWQTVRHLKQTVQGIKDQ